MPREAEDLTGQVFNGRQVLSRALDRQFGRYLRTYWRVRCLDPACGYETEVQGSSLKRGAGCQKCMHRRRKHNKGKAKSARATRQAPAPAPAPPTAPPSPASATPAPMTVADLQILLRGLQPDAPIMVQLVSDSGYAVVDMRRPVAGPVNRLVLTAQLPKQLHPWNG